MNKILPSNIANDLLQYLSYLAESEISLYEFLKQIDILNRKSLPQMRKKGLSERHAKAILLKLSNIAVSRYQYLRRHRFLIARPFGLIVDPSNACPLECPGCIHRKRKFEKSNIDWINGTLKEKTLDKLLATFGPFAINTQYFNWGEPLLNKSTPQFIKNSRRFLMRTSVSTNLSVNFDAEALISSGLDYLVMSIDGATAATYEKYRVGGNFGLVLSNIEKLVEARKKLKSQTPVIVWQYLLFDHTISEMDQAKILAEKLGVDRIIFAEPYDVSKYDPKITKPNKCPVRVDVFDTKVGAGRWSIVNALSNLDPIIDDQWETTWFSRMDDTFTDHSKSETCLWLYMNMAMDAKGRIMPCCFEPLSNPTSIFGDINKNVDVFNTSNYIKSREGFFKSDFDGDHITVCSICPHKKSTPNINYNHLKAYFNIVEF